MINIYSGVKLEPEYISMLVVDGKNSIVAVKQDGTTDVYSNKIEKVISMSNAIIENINENYSRIYNYSEIKYINKNGEIVQNTEVYENYDLYAYEENGKWGFKSKNGKTVVNPEYDFVTELNEYGFAGILKDGKWGIIDANGKKVVDCEYEIETYYLPDFVGKYLLELTNIYYCREIN